MQDFLHAPDSGFDELPLEVSVAAESVLRAMAHQRVGSSFRQRLEQAEHALLTVVLDVAVALVDGPALEQLLAVTAAELGP